ncbi:glycosyltransferase [uncultured Lutibacter sp.]|uniref:glycosyltransferase family 2 protein n=1 Tax=uncultured Lutibacter sp. TaxID=437739 RepID=UPI002624A411|nr:glycosyltransferase [uncultured Lutibacter sp.]
MISVLIPVYNYNVINLVTSIKSQLQLANIDYEIICIDDASTEYFNQNNELQELKNVAFYKLTNNIGRSKIRNLLVDKSKFEWLLFLDSDVIPENNNFIKEYLNCIHSNEAKVYCGGIKYDVTKPVKDKILRWFYGKNREEVNSVVRNEKPYQYFFGANFLIHKSVFNTCKFNENIVKYGYEDVFFVEDLRRNNIVLLQVSNEVYHLGIEYNSVFLYKTKEAIENLYHFSYLNNFTADNIKILNTYYKIEKYKLSWLFSNLYKLFHNLFEYNLKSKYPSMFIFDLYKLTYFCFLSKNNLA